MSSHRFGIAAHVKPNFIVELPDLSETQHSELNIRYVSPSVYKTRRAGGGVYLKLKLMTWFHVRRTIRADENEKRKIPPP